MEKIKLYRVLRPIDAIESIENWDAFDYAPDPDDSFWVSSPEENDEILESRWVSLDPKKAEIINSTTVRWFHGMDTCMPEFSPMSSLLSWQERKQDYEII